MLRRRFLLPTGIVGSLLALWIGSYAGTALVVTRAIDAPDAIVMLASHEWERLPAAAALARANPDATVLLTEPRELTPYNCHLCGERSAWLVNLGVAPGRVVVLSRRVGNTFEEALAARAYSDEHRVEHLMIVTSPYHTRRALAVFSAVFARSRTEVGVQPALRESPARPASWWAAPYDRAYVRYEWAALAWYVVRHRVSPFVHFVPRGR